MSSEEIRACIDSPYTEVILTREQWQLVRHLFRPLPTQDEAADTGRAA